MNKEELKEIAEITKKLDKNLAIFNKLEKQYEKLKSNKDATESDYEDLMVAYAVVSKNIKELKKQSEKYKDK